MDMHPPELLAESLSAASPQVPSEETRRRLIDHQTRRGGNATNAEEEGADGFLNVP